MADRFARPRRERVGVGPADRQQVGAGTACSALPTGNADFGNFDLWFPKSSIDPAEASGRRPCRPADPVFREE